MTIYLDWHRNGISLPNAISEKKNGDFAIKIIRTIEANGEVYLLLDAPDKETVQRYHLEVGQPCGWIEEITSMQSFED